VALCGNGFTAPRSPHGPFLYADHPALAAAANSLQHLFTVHGPRPGDRLTVPTNADPVTVDEVGWVHRDPVAEQAGYGRQRAFLTDPRPVAPTPIGPPITPADAPDAAALVTAALPALARGLIATRTGALAVGMHDYLSGPLGPHRAVLRLLDPPGAPGTTLSYAWDITGPTLTPVPTSERDSAMATYPFGAEIFYRDFVALLRGQVQIWDIIGGSFQGWHIGEPLDSLVYALFAIYGEHQRPDLARACYTRVLPALSRATMPA
jgi:hypothetical protein